MASVGIGACTVNGNDWAPTSGQLQDLLLDSPGFSEFLLGLTAISASLLAKHEPMLCAITVEREGSPATVASSTDVARRLDEKQYTFDDGPCLTALRHQRLVLIEDLAAEDRWDQYAAAVAGEGIRSVLAVPIPTDSSSRAALNCYARTVGIFDAATVTVVTEHAAMISKTLLLALRLHAPEPFPAHLRSALRSRAVLDAAVARIMAQNRCGRDEAISLLHVAALDSNARIRDIAVSILDGTRHPVIDGPATAEGGRP